MPAAALPPLSLNAWMRWDLIRPWAERAAPRRVLEAGVGGGAIGARLAAMTPEYWGVEPDGESRRLARGRIRDAVIVADLADLPDGDVDLLCAFEVLEHLEDDVGALRDWCGRLAPGGWFIASVPSDPARYGAWDTLAGHLRRYRDDDLRQLLDAAGLTTSSVEPYGFPIGWPLEALRNRAAARRGSDDVRPDEVRTATSGRLLQPRPWMAAATTAASAPFRLVQRHVRHRGPRTGAVVVGRRPG